MRPEPLHRTKRGFHVVLHTNDLNREEYQVRNWRGTVLTTRRFLPDAIVRANELEELQITKEGGHGQA